MALNFAIGGWLRRAAPRAPESEPRPPDEPRRADAQAVLRRLEWTVIRRLDGLLQGDYRTLFRGFGLDLADLREYQPHDDVRYIDWNVTARLQVPHVREFQEDREIAAWFLLDLSGSVDFGSQGQRKRSVSEEFVAVLARLLTRYGNRVGAILYREGADQMIPARGGRRQVLHLMERMRRFGQARGSGRETDLGELIEAAHRSIRRRSVVFVVSDFISRPGWGRRLALLARRHEIVAVRLFDPLEMELPDLGLVVLQDAETGEQMFVDTHDQGFRRRFAEAATLREAQLRGALAEAGVDCLELATGEDIDQAILRFTRLRKQRSRLASGGGLRKAPAR
ncbi:MAG: DUF58 domain-containing protein [Burkholderiales bacterium]|nr:DUF58 domain-containing protein [Burkholderiales bacterium]